MNGIWDSQSIVAEAWILAIHVMQVDFDGPPISIKRLKRLLAGANLNLWQSVFLPFSLLCIPFNQWQIARIIAYHPVSAL